MPNYTLSFDFAAPSSSPSSSRREKRSASQTPRSRSVPARSAAVASKKAVKSEEKPTVQAKAPSAPAKKVAAPKPAKSAVKVAASKTAVQKTATEKTSPATSAEKPAVKAKRVRAPKNLAAQYGESEAENKPRAASEILLEPPKKSRRTAKARAKRHEAMQVDDDLLQRLARAGSASSLVIGEEEAPAKARRSRKWEIMCGKCGHDQSAKTAAALCDGCGTILLREAARLEN